MYLTVCMYTMGIKYSRRPEEDMESPGSGVTDACKRLWGFWKLDLGPLKKQPGLLMTKQCLQALKQYITGHVSQFCY